MAGPGLEIFKFGLYLVVPIGLMIHYSKPEWYTKNVDPYRARLFPPLEKTNQKIPADQATLREELAKMRAERREKRLQREQQSSGDNRSV